MNEAFKIVTRMRKRHIDIVDTENKCVYIHLPNGTVVYVDWSLEETMATVHEKSTDD